MNKENNEADHVSEYNGFYQGIVVQNNDPEMRGRVKILVPEHAPTILSLNKDTMEGVILKFKNIHKGASVELDAALDKIKSALPWAEQASPLFGGTSSGIYNYKSRTANNQDGGFPPNPSEENRSAALPFELTTAEVKNDPETYRGANQFVGENMEVDPFVETKKNGNHAINPLSKQYQPSNYSGMARGIFSIPNVGAHVYVFYDHGNPMSPVYFAAAMGQSDWKRIYTMSEDDKTTNATDYPLGYENSPDGDNGRFRSKTVLNTNKHTLEFIDTDGHESIKLNAFNGSFKEYSNEATIELDTGNRQNMVMGDDFETVSGNKTEYTGYDREIITNGNRYDTTGVQPKEVIDEIVALHKKEHIYKRLFPTTHVNPNMPPTECSQFESMDGSFDTCPICGHPSEQYTRLPSPMFPMKVITADWHDTMVPIEPSPIPMTGGGIFANSLCPSCLNKEWMKTPWFTGIAGKSPSTENGDWAPTDFSKLAKLIKKHAYQIPQLEKKIGRGGDEIHKVSMSKIETIGQTFNDMESTRTDPIGRLVLDGCHVAMNGCTPYYLPTPLVQYVDVADIPGGDYILTAMNKMKVNVGARGISMQTVGPMDLGGSIMNLASLELNLVGKNSVSVEGGELINLRARKIVMSPKNHNSVMIDGQLHVDRNIIVAGGMYVEGELGLQHITCPLEWHTTWSTCWGNMPTCILNCVYMLPYFYGPGKIILPRHEHYFRGIPTTYTKDSAQTRLRMRNKGINDRSHVLTADRVMYEPRLPTCGGMMPTSYQPTNPFLARIWQDHHMNMFRSLNPIPKTSIELSNKLVNKISALGKGEDDRDEQKSRR